MNENMPKNNKKGLVVVIVIMALLIIGLSSYIVYDKVLKVDKVEEKNEKEDKDTKKEDKKEETKEESKEEQLSEKELADILQTLEMNEGATAFFNAKDYYFNSLSDLSDQDLSDFAFYRAWTLDMLEDLTAIDALKISDLVNVDYNFKSITAKGNYGAADGFDEDEYTWIYDKSTNKYKVNDELAARGFIGISTLNKVISSSKKDGIYTIKLYRIFSNPHDIGLPTHFYATTKDALAQKNPVYEVDIDAWVDDTFKEEDAFETTEGYKTYTMTFIKDDNGYLIQSYNID